MWGRSVARGPPANLGYWRPWNYDCQTHILSAMTPEPWFSNWNYGIMRHLFNAIPHNASTDTVFEFLSRNRLATTWIFAAVFYVFWNIQDSRTPLRRGHLFQIIVAFGIAVLITLVVRPWIAWPAPALSPRFQPLYPSYFWGNGSSNSFPSHSTLAYFLVSAGVGRLNWRISVALAALVLPLISIPLIYIGGHYPIDIISSVVLATVVLALVWQWPVPVPVANWLARKGRKAALRELFIIFWIFELAEGFRGATDILISVKH
jgi:membrane-associated phospholipid phosphatase